MIYFLIPVVLLVLFFVLQKLHVFSRFSKGTSSNPTRRPKPKFTTYDSLTADTSFKMTLQECAATLPTFLHALLFRAKKHPKRVAFTWLDGEGREEDRLTYHQLAAVCTGFANNDLGKLEPLTRVLVILPPGLEYIVAFMGALSAGVMPVPVYPAFQLGEPMEKMNDIAQDSGATVVITNRSIYGALRTTALFKKIPFSISKFQTIFVPSVWDLKIKYPTITKTKHELKRNAIGKNKNYFNLYPILSITYLEMQVLIPPIKK